ncbi:TPA: hypothetical protein EYP70_03790, partial [Candidatus Bathyarchaeota archaeon]|nr:hypothetical protein [Candidatus Bathyarchaeota archaeon]
MKVGFSTLDITPPLGSEVPGGFLKNRLYDVHDPLHVKAVVFEGGDGRAALVQVDALSIKASVVKEGRRIAEGLTGISSSNIMVAATHTHRGGPVVDWTAGRTEEILARSRDPEFLKSLIETAPSSDHKYLSFLAERIGSAVALADKGKVEALCAVGVGKEAAVSFNRRFKMKGGFQATHPGKGNPDIIEPAGPIDPDVGVLSVWSVKGEFLGCIVNFACHGTTMNCPGFSSDWPYYLDSTIRSVMGEKSTVIFLNGACGDVTQVDNLSMREREFGEKWARRVGQKVGAEALKVISEAEPAELKPVDAAQTVIQIEKRRILPEQLRNAYRIVKNKGPGEDGWVFARDIIILNELNMIEPKVNCEIQAIQVGPAVYISNPAELFCQLGLKIKQASPFPYTFIVEL